MKTLLPLFILMTSSGQCFGETVSTEQVPAEPTVQVADFGKCQDIAAGACMGRIDRQDCLKIAQATPQILPAFKRCMSRLGEGPASKSELKKLVEHDRDLRPILPKNGEG